MSEQALSGGASRERRPDRFAELPYYFQQLGKASKHFGVVADFFMIVEGDFPLDRAYRFLVSEMSNVSGLAQDEVEKILRVDFDVVPTDDDMVEPPRPRW